MMCRLPPGDPKKRCMLLRRIREETARKTACLDVQILARPGGSREKRLLEGNLIFPLSRRLHCQIPLLPPFISRRIALARIATASSPSCEGCLGGQRSLMSGLRDSVVSAGSAIPRWYFLFASKLGLHVLHLGPGVLASLSPPPPSLTFRSSSFARR